MIMKREFVMFDRSEIWHMMNADATQSRCNVTKCHNDVLPPLKIVKVVFAAKPPKPFCHGCASGSAKLLADMARCNRQPNRRDILSTRLDWENSPTSFPEVYSEKTTIGKSKAT